MPSTALTLPGAAASKLQLQKKMLVPISRTTALLSETFILKEWSFFFFSFPTEVANWQALERMQPIELFVWPAWCLFLLFYYKRVALHFRKRHLK